MASHTPCLAKESLRAPRFQQPTFGAPSNVWGTEFVLFNCTPTDFWPHIT